MVGGWLFLSATTSAQTLQDTFTNRQTISSVSGQLLQNNSTATLEPNEPRHGGKPGGHSLWISWLAPTNGIIRFKTETSTFDTLLSAYKFTTTNETTFADLREVARADDSEGLDFESEIEFGVIAGERYEIAVDGYFGAVGMVDFRWTFTTLPAAPPQIFNLLNDYAVNIGDPVSLTFNVTNPVAGTYKWLLNGNEISGATSTTLSIASFSPGDVGHYKLRINLGGGVQFFSVPVELQINTEGSATTLAQGKVFDAPATPLIGSSGGGAGFLRRLLTPGVVRGYNGSQVFNTTFAVVDPSEPPHCGVNSSKSYWLVYQPPVNGTVTLDTLGSAYDTVMETYTSNGTPTGYQDFISLDCANDSFTTNTASRIILPVAKTRQYYIVVAGVNGASGTAWINYKLNTNQPPLAPSLTSTPQPQTVAAGSTVAFTAPVSGALPMFFTWRKDNVLLPGKTSAALVLTNVNPTQNGSYAFTVTNDMGSATGTFVLKVVVPTQCRLTPIPNGLQLSYSTLVGQTYTTEESTNLRLGWTPWPGSFVGNGLTNYFNILNLGTRFFRVRVE